MARLRLPIAGASVAALLTFCAVVIIVVIVVSLSVTCVGDGDFRILFRVESTMRSKRR
jgi:hypothetical protein